MPRIHVEFAGLKQAGTTCRDVSSKVSDIRSNFKNTIRQLDWDVKFQSDINSTASQLSRKLDAYAAALKKYQQFLDEAHSTYRELDQLEFDGFGNLSKGPTSDTESAAEKNPTDQFMTFIKAILKWRDKTGGDDTAGITKDGISYLQSVYKFFSGDKTGLTGAENWLDLCDNSIGVWTGFYDYLKDFYNKAGKIFSTENQKGVAGLGIAGNVVGLVGDLFGAADTISNTENIGIAGTTGEILGASDKVIDIWGSVEKLCHVGDSATNITTKSGLYSPLSFYTAAAKSYLSAGSQAFTSYEKYAADGSWSTSDVASTGIEAGVAGLCSMADSLTFGLLSEKSTGVSASDISSKLETWGSQVGTEAGNYIASDPTLRQMYQNANTAGKTLLTFYAAVHP